MIQREQADIQIRRGWPTGVDLLATVPITGRSVRRFLLMQEDCIQLDFSLAEAVHFTIGDYIDDELFGKFVIAEEQMPKYNVSTGGYDYSLRFVAPYMMWRNYIHCLIIQNQRKETEWNLTDRLEVHAQLVADNVNLIFRPTISTDTNVETGEVINHSTGYVVDVDGTIDRLREVKHLHYSGTDIIGALNMMADAWECEWWVDNAPKVIGNTTYGNTIHFGKCDKGNTPYEFMLGDNVETMEVTRDQQTYATKIFAYGGTENIPEDYGKRLVFTATTWNARQRVLNDSTRPLTLDMIQGDGDVVSESLVMGSWSSGGTNPLKYTQRSATYNLSGVQTFRGYPVSTIALSSIDWNDGNLPLVTGSMTLYHGNEAYLIRTEVGEGEIVDGHIWTLRPWREREIEFTLDLGESQDVYVEIEWSLTYVLSDHTEDTIEANTTGRITAVADDSTATKPVTVMFGGADYGGTFYGSDGTIKFNNLAPRGFGLGSQYELSPLDLTKIPLYYFSDDYDTGTMRTAGDKRLHLPLATCPNRYVERAVDFASQAVEIAVVFDKIFPKMSLMVTDIKEVKKQLKVEHSDGSVSWEDWTQYLFTVGTADGGEFDFRASYMLDGAKLQAAFTTPSYIASEGFMLAGMTFDVGYGNNGSYFSIIRNEEYGALLPNEVLKPSIGDTLFLTGWNPRYVSDLLVGSAEAELEQSAREYLDVLNEGQFTSTCHMMSDWPLQLSAEQLADSNGNELNDVNGNALMLGEGLSADYFMPTQGTRVTIYHDAFPEGEKTSRVIGYEFKLDLPFDTPTFTIGETEAFSRLKKIEKEITKLM